MNHTLDHRYYCYYILYIDINYRNEMSKQIFSCFRKARESVMELQLKLGGNRPGVRNGLTKISMTDKSIGVIA